MITELRYKNKKNKNLKIKSFKKLYNEYISQNHWLFLGHKLKFLVEISNFDILII